jgi:hypothetical protein
MAWQILGNWYLEKNANIRIEFLKNGTANKYTGDKLDSTMTYWLTDSCNNETGYWEIFLKIQSPAKDVQCLLIKKLDKDAFVYIAYYEAPETRLIRKTKPGGNRHSANKCQ